MVVKKRRRRSRRQSVESEWKKQSKWTYRTLFDRFYSIDQNIAIAVGELRSFPYQAKKLGIKVDHDLASDIASDLVNLISRLRSDLLDIDTLYNLALEEGDDVG